MDGMFHPKYPVANEDCYKSAYKLAKIHSHKPHDDPSIKEQADATIAYLNHLDGPPKHDYYRDAVRHVIQHDPGDDPGHSGSWSPDEVEQVYGHETEQQAREWLYIHNPELFPNQVGE